jgi:predicted flap endonuclease-1-like 5' DNA nuclease
VAFLLTSTIQNHWSNGQLITSLHRTASRSRASANAETLFRAGQQFKARFMHTSAPTSIDGIEKYLGSGMIRGIGPVYAKRLVQAFGEKVFDTIEAESDRLREVTGIGPLRAKRNTDAWAEQKVVREIMVFLHSNGVGTARAVHIYKTYGGDAVQVGHDGKLVPPGARHSRHWLQDRRRHRYEAWREKDRHDPGARRHLVCPDRNDGRRALRAPHGEGQVALGTRTRVSEVFGSRASLSRGLASP